MDGTVMRDFAGRVVTVIKELLSELDIKLRACRHLSLWSHSVSRQEDLPARLCPTRNSKT